MARKVIDIIYNLVRKRLAVFNTKASGSGITRIPTDRQIKKSMEDVFQTLKDGGYNVVSAEKAIQNEDDLARILTKIQQDKIADATARQKAAERLERVMDKMNRGIPLNPSDQASLEGSGFKTTLDAFKGFEPKVIPGGKKPRDKKSKGGLMNAIKNLLKKSKPKKSGDKIYGVGGEEIDVADLKKSLGLDEATDKKSMEDLEKKLQMIIGKERTKHAKGGLMNAVKKLQKKFGKNIIQKGKAPKKSEKKKLQDLFREFNRKNKAGGGLAYMLGEPRVGLANGGTFTQSLPSLESIREQYGESAVPSLEGGEIVYDTGNSLIYQRPGQRGFELFNPREGYFTSLGSGFANLQELFDFGGLMRNPNDPVRLAQEAAAATRAKVNIPTPTPTPMQTPTPKPTPKPTPTPTPMQTPTPTPIQTPIPGTLRLEDIDQTGMPRPITQEDVDTFNFRPTGSDPLSQNIFSGVFNALVGARPQGVESLSLANTFEENLALNEKRRLANQAFRQGAMDLLSRRDSLTNEDIIDFGKNLGIPENVSSDVLNRLPTIMEGLRSEGGLSGIIPPEFGLGKIMGSPDALYGADPRLADDPLAGSFSGGFTLDGRRFLTEQDAIAGLGLERYNQLMATGGRVGFADGGMSRRTFLKIMAALAAFPLVGKLTKTAKVAKGTAPLVTKTSEMPEHFPKLVEKILREGQVVKKDFVKKTGDVTTYRHPDRPDIELTIEGEGNRIQLDFDTDQGMRGGYEFRKGDIIDEPTSKMRGKRGPDEFIEGEVKYKTSGDGYTKDFEEGIDTGTENLDEFAGVGKQKTSKSKINLDQDFAAGGLAGLLGE
jgi:hypothetical protein